MADPEQTVDCPRPDCGWTMTGTTDDLLAAFRAHKLLDHGIPPLRWNPLPDGGWRGG